MSTLKVKYVPSTANLFSSASCVTTPSYMSPAATSVTMPICQSRCSGARHQLGQTDVRNHSDFDISSIFTLRSPTEIQTQVNTRLQEVEQVTKVTRQGNPDKTEFILFGSKNIRTKLFRANFSQLIYLVPSCHLPRQLGTLVSGLILILPSLAMSGISVRLVLFISGI